MVPYLLLLTALRSLKNHKTRTLLTTLGMIIGVVSIIAVMSIGEGAKKRVQSSIEDLGTNFIIVLAGEPKHKAMGASSANLSLKKRDLKTIMQECDDISEISPMIHTPVKAIHENKNWKTLIAGTYPNYMNIREWPLQKGEFFTKQDSRAANKVAVIGQTVVKELFGKKDPLGKIIRVKGLPFKVIGVLVEKGKMPSGLDQDDAIFAPFETVQKKIMGVRGFAAMILSAKSDEVMAEAAREIKSILRQTHKIKPQDDDDFTIFTQDDISKAADAASKVLNVLLIIIASISLLVGGIGIMNIMLVSVSERTKEIGIRMALGATTSNILNQFILEAIVICLCGGLLGFFLGMSIAEVVGIALKWPISISTKSILLSLSSCGLVGLFFGYYPAYKASQMNPVDALADR
jgi:putative ABC transport system permease protein